VERRISGSGSPRRCLETEESDGRDVVPERKMRAMAELSERHEVRIRGTDQTIVFIADSEDDGLVRRQELDRKHSKEVCAITLANPDELCLFFKGLRRILASLGHPVGPADVPQPARKRSPRAIELRLQRLGLVPRGESA
jgi:hypothetical protein